MTASPPSQSLRWGNWGNWGAKKKIVSNGCMSHVVPLHFRADPHVSELPRGRHKCWRQHWTDRMGLLMLEIYAPCSMQHAWVWDTLTVQQKSLCNNIHEYFDRPWVSSFSLSLSLFPTRRLLRFQSDMHAPKFR